MQQAGVTALVLFGLTAFALGHCTAPARAHDSWINQGGFKNPAGEWCCGEGDCEFRVETSDGAVRVDRVREFVPASEALPSPDGAYWRCHRPDGSRRCFFVPPPNS